LQTAAKGPPVPGATNRTFSSRQILVLTIAQSVVVFCASCAGASKLYPVYMVRFDPHAVASAATAAALFAPIFLLFVLAEFSFGYLVGFYLCAMVVGYVWLSFFSVRIYDHEAGRLSAAVSALVFLLPALFVSSPLPRLRDMSVKSFDRLAVAIFLACAAMVAVASTYSFRLVSPADASNLRADPFPSILNYLIGITSSSVLPFLFAYCVARRALWQAGAIVVLMLLYYPLAVSKMTFFVPAWLIVMTILARLFGTRMAVVLSLLLPLLAGLLLFPFIGGNGALSQFAAGYYFTVNFRILAVPSIALDLYNEFFSKYELTHFCQIGALKRVLDCPYQDQLAVVMLKYFPGGGTYNGSLFTTEGVASVGSLYAPATVFLCGLIIAFGNRASAGLPPSMVLVSAGWLAQTLLNVPLSTVLLSHGGGLLFLLWYLTPRDAFNPQPSPPMPRGAFPAGNS